MVAAQELDAEGCRSGVYAINADLLAVMLQGKSFPEGFLVSIIDGAVADSWEGFFTGIAHALEFPAHFGRNWDAVYDCLTDLSWLRADGFVLVLDDFDRLATNEPDQSHVALKVLHDACAFWRPLDRPLFVLLSGSVGPRAGLSELPECCLSVADERASKEDGRMMAPSPETAFDRDIARSWELNREGRGKEALAILRALVDQYPDEPRAHFEYAGALDFQGREAEAVAPYRRAQALGLSGDDLPRLHVQLGSTLRNIGEYEDAERFLAVGRARFPDHAGIQAFHALALVSADRCAEAVVTLLDLVTSNAERIDLDGYDRALRAYADELRAATATEIA